MTVLEPDLGGSTPAATPPPAPVTAPEPVDLASLFTPSLPAALETRISANLAGGSPAASPVTNPTATPIPAGPESTDGLDTNAIITNLPDMKAAFVNKYTRIGPSLMKVSEPVRRSLVDLDLQRINKGQPPLNDKDSLAAILAATKKEAITKPAKDESILGRIANIPESMISDMGAILKGIPHLPIAVWDEVVHNIPAWSKHYNENIKAGMNPVAAFLNSPGVRFIPGSFTAGALAQGGKGIGDLLDHPLMTALDVMPYANAAAKATEVGALAAMANKSPLIAKIGSKAVAVDDPAAILLRGDVAINDAGKVLVPNKLGALKAKAAAETSVGRWVTEAFGRDARTTSIIDSQGNEILATGLMGKTPVKGRILGRENVEVEQTIRDSYALYAGQALDEFQVNPERSIAITDQLRIGENNRAFIDSLPDNEAAFAHRVIELGDSYRRYGLKDEWLGQIGGEVYDITTAGKINKAIDKASTLQAKVVDDIRPRFDAMAADIETAIADSLGPRTPRSLRVARDRTYALRDAIDAALDPNNPATFSDAVKVSQGIRQGRTALGSSSKTGDLAGPRANIRLDSLEKIHSTLKQAAKAEYEAGRRLHDYVPARFHDVVQKLAEERVQGQLIASGLDPEDAVRIVMERDYAAYSDYFTKELMDETIRDIAPTWRELREAGYDPMFVHRVDSSGEALLRIPKVSAFNQTLKQAKERTITDPSLHNQDVTVALAHQGAEILAKKMSQETIDATIDTFGVPEANLRTYYTAIARDEAVYNPTMQVPNRVMELMHRDYVQYTPENFRSFPKSHIFDRAGEQIWIPKSVKNNLERIHNPQISGLAAVLGPTTGVFRTSVLALSPRWHVYNVVGGMMTLMAERGPGAFLEFGKARKLLKRVAAGEEVLPDQVTMSLGVSRRDAAEVAALNRGRGAAKVWQKVQEHKAAQLGSKVVQKSYDLNAWFDDTYRVMSYLHGEKSALGKGIAPDVAERMGLESMRKTSQFWAELTPIERNTIRQIFPFYAFTGHMMRYVMKYPFNHPMRAAIVANIVKAELVDQKDGLGQSFFDSIGIGKIGPDGKQLQVSLTGVNPFSNVADQFTIAGFLSGINPIIGTALEQSGFTSNPGGIYGDKVYDPATGKLATAKPNLVPSLVANILPQSQAVVRAAGWDAKYNELLRNNPDAAQRLMSSSIGVPNVLRKVNVPQQYMRAELARQEAQRLAFRSALKSGDWSEAEKYPALRPILDQIRALRDQGALTAYNPQSTTAATGVAGVAQSVGTQLPWPT